MHSPIILSGIMLIHFSAVFIVFKNCSLRNANIHFWGLLSILLGALALPLFFLFTSTEDFTFKPVQESSKYRIARYALCGSFAGVLVALINISHLVKHDTSTFIFYIPLIFFPSFLVSSPWSLASIFTENLTYKITIMSIGASLNGIIIGSAYGILNDKP